MPGGNRCRTRLQRRYVRRQKLCRLLFRYFARARRNGGQTSFSSENTARCCANANMVSNVQPASSTTEPAIQTSSKHPCLPKAHCHVAMSMSTSRPTTILLTTTRPPMMTASLSGSGGHVFSSPHTTSESTSLSASAAHKPASPQIPSPSASFLASYAQESAGSRGHESTSTHVQSPSHRSSCHQQGTATLIVTHSASTTAVVVHDASRRAMARQQVRPASSAHVYTLIDVIHNVC